jgi:hypothetical protein
VALARDGGRKRLLKGINCALIIGLSTACLQAQGGPITVTPQARTIFGRAMSGQTNLVQVYDTANGWGVTFLEPPKPINPLNYNQEQLYYNFFNVLNRQYPTTTAAPWNFVGDARAFSPNSLQVHTYSAIGTAAAVGADIDVEYKPAAGSTDPTANMHWIQTVSTNNKITIVNGEPTSNPGTSDNKIDVRSTNTVNPYYDNGFAANSRNFIDRPRRPDVEFDNTWIAALFLASGPSTPGKVTIYNDSGILWGWQNFFFPNVGLAAFQNDVEQVLTRQELTLVSSDQYTTYVDQFEYALSAVPEPPTVVSVCIAGAFGLVCSRRRLGCTIPSAA